MRHTQPWLAAAVVPSLSGDTNKTKGLSALEMAGQAGGALGTASAWLNAMMVLALTIYLTVTCLFIAGLACAASRRMPSMPEAQVKYPARSQQFDTEIRKAA